jgi:hypothetical protein
MRYTPLQLIIRTHYQMVDAESGVWDKTRVRKLCDMLSITQDELASLLRIQPYRFEIVLTTRKVPGCVKLLLDIFERSAFSKYLGQTYETSLFPNI